MTLIGEKEVHKFIEARGFYYVGLKLIIFEYVYTIQINKNDWIFLIL